MALRVSIGAGRRRLIQLVLVESAMLAVLASTAGALFASWSAPWVVSMLARPNEPIRLILDADWRALGLSVGLALFVTLLFGLTPALRASAVKPISALKGEDSHSRRRQMKSLVAAQMAFCVLVQFIAGLFVATLQRLSSHPLGFSSQRVLLLDTEVHAKLAPAAWMQVADRLRNTPGVEAAGFAGWALMSGNRWRSGVHVPGHILEALPPKLPRCHAWLLRNHAHRLAGGQGVSAGRHSGTLGTEQPACGRGRHRE